MYRVVLFSNPVTNNGETFYGRLYSGTDLRQILSIASNDYKTLLINEQWDGEQGGVFRQRENWIMVRNEDGTESWDYNDKYTYNLGFICIPDQFVKTCNLNCKRIALLNVWVPFRLADIDMEDYIINGVFHAMVMNANPNEISWYSILEKI